MAKRKDNGNTDTQTATAAAAAGEEAGMHAGAILGAEGHAPGQGVILSVAPEEVLLDERLQKLRAWTGSSLQELAIPELARTMFQEGQEQACRARPNKDGDLVLVTGHRRRAAVIYAREQGWRIYQSEDDTTGEEMLLDVVVEEMDDDRALRLAMIENVQRQDFTAIEFAHAIGQIRETFRWEGKKGTAEVAEFLGVSPATVTEAEKLLTLPEDVQEDIQTGRLSKGAALELVAVAKEAGEAEKPVVRAAVLSKAQELADKEAEKKARKGKTSGKTVGKAEILPAGASGGEEPDAETSRIPDEPVEPVKPKKGKVTGKHVRQAAKQTPGAGAGRAPRMSEFTDLMDLWAGEEAWSYPEVMRKFAAAASLWGHGKKSDKFLFAAWEDIADSIPTTRPKPVKEKAAARPKKPAGKKIAKSAGKGKGKAGKAGKPRK